MQIIDTNSPDEWRAALMELPYDLRDVKMTREWAALFDRQSGGMAKSCLGVMRTKDYIVALSFAVRQIPGSPTRSDILIHSGPFSTAPIASRAHGVKFLHQWRVLMSSLKAVSVVGLLNPLYAANQDHLLGFTPQRPVRDVVFKKVEHAGAAAAHMADDQIANLKIAYKSGLMVLGPQAPAEEFAALYAQAMARKAAPARWNFPPEYFSALAEAIPESRFVLIGRDRPEVGALFLFGGACAHYYLAATTDAPPRGAAVMAILEGVRLAHDVFGSAWVYLGGGLRDGDGLFDFKRRVGNVVVPAYTVESVIDYDAYAYLSEPVAGDPNFFPAYRAMEAT